MNYNLSIDGSGIMSVRMLESLLRVTKANTLLLGHENVMLEDALDACLFMFLSGNRDPLEGERALIDLDYYG